MEDVFMKLGVSFESLNKSPAESRVLGLRGSRDTWGVWRGGGVEKKTNMLSVFLLGFITLASRVNQS